MSIEKYSRSLQVELGKILSNRRKIYLDTRFWIILRQAALENSDEQDAKKLLHYLRSGVSCGRLICPISASIFLEIMKQPYTPSRRIGTARLIDELSLGTTMIPLQTVMETEIASFLSRISGEKEIFPMQELIWTKVACVLGDIYPHPHELSADDKIYIQKCFLRALPC